MTPQTILTWTHKCSGRENKNEGRLVIPPSPLRQRVILRLSNAIRQQPRQGVSMAGCSACRICLRFGRVNMHHVESRFFLFCKLNCTPTLLFITFSRVSHPTISCRPWCLIEECNVSDKRLDLRCENPSDPPATSQ